MKSSGDSPTSSPALSGNDVLLVVVCAVVVFAISARWVFVHGYTLYYGDGEAHLNIARSILDSRTPGPDQIGTVWLPVPHILMTPLAAFDSLWRSGLAGAYASVACMVAAVTFLFCGMVLATGTRAAGWTAAGLFVLNPNVLYLGSIPMSEAAAMAGFFGMVLATVQFGRTGGWWALLAAAGFSNWLSLTRYEGWFVIPFVALYVLGVARGNRWVLAVVFGGLAALGPLAWVAHNWWYTGNPLDFYNGPYSARAIQGDAYYPGRGEWGKAWLYYRTAVILFAGWGAILFGLAGAVYGLFRRWWWPVVFCSLLPAFYLLSMHGSSTPIRVPVLWPGDWYNSRYALSAMPLLAVGGGFLAAVRLGAAPLRSRFDTGARLDLLRRLDQLRESLAPLRSRLATSIVVVAVAALPWVGRQMPDDAICWKESQVNSMARRAWTAGAADFLRSAYRAGDGVMIAFGDPIGILREAGIPIREALHEGNGAAWMLATARPDVLLHERWAVAVGDDAVAKAMARSGGRYQVETIVRASGGPPVRIYRLVDENPIH